METKNVCYGIVGNPDFVEEYKIARKKIKGHEIAKCKPENAANDNNDVYGIWPEKWTLEYVNTVCINVTTDTQTFTFNELYFRKLMLCLSV